MRYRASLPAEAGENGAGINCRRCSAGVDSVSKLARRRNASAAFPCVGHLLDHLPVIGCLADQLNIEIDDDLGLEVDSMTEIFDRNFGTLRHANLVQQEYRRPVVWTRALKLVNKVFGIADWRDLVPP